MVSLFPSLRLWEHAILTLTSARRASVIEPSAVSCFPVFSPLLQQQLTLLCFDRLLSRAEHRPIHLLYPLDTPDCTFCFFFTALLFFPSRD
jgi:hypothetical protein